MTPLEYSDSVKRVKLKVENSTLTRVNGSFRLRILVNCVLRAAEHGKNVTGGSKWPVQSTKSY